MASFSTLLLLLSAAVSVRAQFPRACAFNASRADAVCCPPNPHSRSQEVCGGRGECRRIPTMLPSQRTLVPRHLRLDDRLDWPQRFFSFACKCSGNFWGYACHRCKPGWHGRNCNQRGVRTVRKNANSLTRKEREMYLAVLNRAKTELSDWVVLNTTSHENGDPICAVDLPLQLYNVSVYDFLIYLHVYSARSTLLRDMGTTCLPSTHLLDFAHRGPGFLTWHRFYLLEAEYQLEEVRRQLYGESRNHFAIPYWDWINGENCSVCHNGLVGLINETHPELRLHNASAFHSWRVFCGTRVGRNDCHTCDPTEKHEFLWRGYHSDPTFRTLPRQSEIDYLMSLSQLDVPPYDHNSNASSMRNILEGFVNASNRPNSGGEYLHNLVHIYLNGSNHDFTTSPNDPVFFMHHSFVDKIFEMWLRKFKANATSFPSRARVGHAIDDPVVPAFPRVVNKDFFSVSTNLGFTYDDDNLGNRNYFK